MDHTEQRVFSDERSMQHAAGGPGVSNANRRKKAAPGFELVFESCSSIMHRGRRNSAQGRFNSVAHADALNGSGARRVADRVDSARTAGIGFAPLNSGDASQIPFHRLQSETETMAASKVETWKKMAATAVDGFCNQMEATGKELAELEKKRKAVKAGLEKLGEDVSKKIKLEGYDKSEQEDVDKFVDSVLKRVRQKSSTLKAYLQVYPAAVGGSGKQSINFDIHWD